MEAPNSVIFDAICLQRHVVLRLLLTRMRRVHWRIVIRVNHCSAFCSTSLIWIILATTGCTPVFSTGIGAMVESTRRNLLRFAGRVRVCFGSVGFGQVFACD